MRFMLVDLVTHCVRSTQGAAPYCTGLPEPGGASGPGLVARAFQNLLSEQLKNRGTSDAHLADVTRTPAVRGRHRWKEGGHGGCCDRMFALGCSGTLRCVFQPRPSRPTSEKPEFETQVSLNVTHTFYKTKEWGRNTEGEGEVFQCVFLSYTAASILSNSAESILSYTAASILSNSAESILSNSAESILSNSAESILSYTAASILSNSAESILSYTAASILSNSAESILSNSAESILSYTAASILSNSAESILSYTAASILSKSAESFLSYTAVSFLSYPVVSILSLSAVFYLSYLHFQHFWARYSKVFQSVRI
ncbi:hypothetical protein RRG08_066670 [Elysia crispata]|uniref:Uncharacterized protein n=1 Tax=Elysia crispata TaxID=231223 RepID=A0AAE1B6B9_9GAST|nr:hypothetical protein RRG08_066670 [Elysia crispata]